MPKQTIENHTSKTSYDYVLIGLDAPTTIKSMNNFQI